MDKKPGDKTESSQPADVQDGTLRWLTWQRCAAAFVVYLAIYVAFAFVVPRVHGDFPSAGEFGDMFGVLNAFVSGIAMSGVIIAILLQREQNRMQAAALNVQRQELADTREELKRQSEAPEAQNKHRLLSRWQENKPVVFLSRDVEGYPLIH